MSGDPRLNWAKLGAFHPDGDGPLPHETLPHEPVPRDLARMWRLAGESLGLVARPIERFELAGTLSAFAARNYERVVLLYHDHRQPAQAGLTRAVLTQGGSPGSRRT